MYFRRSATGRTGGSVWMTRWSFVGCLTKRRRRFVRSAHCVVTYGGTTHQASRGGSASAVVSGQKRKASNRSCLNAARWYTADGRGGAWLARPDLSPAERHGCYAPPLTACSPHCRVGRAIPPPLDVRLHLVPHLHRSRRLCYQRPPGRRQRLAGVIA